MLESEHFIDTRCIIVFVCIMYGTRSLNDFIIIMSFTRKFLSVVIRELICIARYANRIYKCPHSGLSGCPHLRGVAQYAFYVNQLEPHRSVRLIEVSIFQGVRIEGFHCTSLQQHPLTTSSRAYK